MNLARIVPSTALVTSLRCLRNNTSVIKANCCRAINTETQHFILGSEALLAQCPVCFPFRAGASAFDLKGQQQWAHPTNSSCLINQISSTKIQQNSLITTKIIRSTCLSKYQAKQEARKGAFYSLVVFPKALFG